MTSNFEIRPATEDDLADMAVIHVRSWRQAYKGQISQEYLDTLSVSSRLQTWRQNFDPRSQNYRLAVASSDARMAGFVSFGRGRDEDKNDQAEIYTLYLLQDYWGKGLGYKIFQYASGQLKASGYRQLYLWVLETNEKAIKSYLQWGGTLDQGPSRPDLIGGKPIKEIAVTFQI